MNFFEQIYHQIFGANAPKRLRVREELRLPYPERYQAWQQSSAAMLRLLRPIHQAYHYKRTGIISPTQVHLHTSPVANGFLVMYQPTFDRHEFRFVMEYFKDKILPSGYYIQEASQILLDKGDFVETTARCYLKPDIYTQARDGLLCDQRFGNILLELVYADDKPMYLKILATCYFDRNFTSPRPFTELMELLFDIVPTT